MAEELRKGFPKLELEVIVTREYEEVLTACGDPTLTDVYEVNVLEQRVAPETGRPSKPLESHPDGHVART
jgi:hypothetical protein